MCGLAGFEKGQGFVVAAALEEMRQLRIYWGRKLGGEGQDVFRNRLQCV